MSPITAAQRCAADALLDLDQALAHGVKHRLRTIVDLELPVDCRDVVANRLLADLEPVADLLVGEAGPDHLEDLDLALRQADVDLLVGAVAADQLEHAVG